MCHPTQLVVRTGTIVTGAGKLDQTRSKATGSCSANRATGALAVGLGFAPLQGGPRCSGDVMMVMTLQIDRSSCLTFTPTCGRGQPLITVGYYGIGEVRRCNHTPSTVYLKWVLPPAQLRTIDSVSCHQKPGDPFARSGNRTWVRQERQRWQRLGARGHLDHSWLERTFQWNLCTVRYMLTLRPFIHLIFQLRLPKLSNFMISTLIDSFIKI